jgi:hypothetical protein
VVASPYGLELVGYYHRTVLNPAFSTYVTEWRATTFRAQNVPVFLLAGAGLWLLGRAGSRASLFEQLAFVALAVAAFDAERNVGWLGLASLLILPRLLEGSARPRRAGRPSPVAMGLVVASAVGLVVAAVATIRAPGHELASRFPARASTVVSQALARDPRARVFSDEHFADWLLWRNPEARGRVAYDARFELLTAPQLTRLYRWTAEATDNWRSAAVGSSIAVVYPRREHRKTAALRRSGARVLYRDAEIAVLALPPGFGRRTPS